MTHPDFSLDQANATRRVAADGLHTNIYPVTASADTLHAAAQVLMDSGTADSDLGVYVLYARLLRDALAADDAIREMDTQPKGRASVEVNTGAAGPSGVAVEILATEEQLPTFLVEVSRVRKDLNARLWDAMRGLIEADRNKATADRAAQDAADAALRQHDANP